MDFPLSAGGSYGSVPRFDARCLTPTDFEALDGSVPMILTHVVDAATSSAWIKRFLERCGGQEITYQTKCMHGRSETATKLSDFPAEMHRSSHNSACTLMSESLLQGEEALVDSVLHWLPEQMQENFFSLFPETLRPSQLCVIAAGRGARCDLHADHLSWTGWNLLLQGSKHWRLFPNNERTLRAFGGWREPHGIWDSGGTQMLLGYAASWNSLVDLYRVRCGVLPPGCASSVYSPGTVIDAPPEVLECELGPDLERFPKAADATGGIEVIQEAGELIVFPGFWWHQTYSYSETWAVCAQYLNRNCLESVLGHIADYCNLDGIAPHGDAPAASTRIDSVLAAALETQGDMVFTCTTGGEVLYRLRGLDCALSEIRGRFSRIPELRTEDLVSALWGSVALRCENRRFRELLVAEAQRRVSEFMPRDLAAACWALARLDRLELGASEIGAGLQLAVEAANRVQEFDAPALASVTWAVARLRLGPAAPLAAASALRASQFSLGHVGCVAWAIASSLGGADQQPALTAIAEASSLARGELSERSLLGVLWAFAELSSGWSPMMETALMRQPRRITECIPSTFARTVWAVATAAIRDVCDGDLVAAEHPLVMALASQSRQRASQLSTGNLACVAWAFALISSRRNGPLHQVLASEAGARVRQFDPGGLAGTTWAFATLRLRDQAFLDQVSKLALRTVCEWSLPHFSAMAWSVASLTGLDAPLLIAAEGWRCRGRRGPVEEPYGGLLLLEPEGC